MLQKATGSTASLKRMKDMVNKVTVTKGDRTKEVTMKRAERMSKRGWEEQKTPKTQAHLERQFAQQPKEGAAEILKPHSKSELTRTTSKIPKYKSKKEVKKIIKAEKKRKRKNK